MVKIDTDAPVALILSPYLGDALFLMAIANNLRNAGRRVVVYGDHGVALAEWFPGFDLRPLAAANEPGALDACAAVVQMSQDAPIAGLAQRHGNFLAIKQSLPRQPADDGSNGLGAPCNGIMATFRRFTREFLGVKDWTHDNGLRAPAPLRHALHPRRVIVHPSSSEPERCWRPTQYAALATALRARGFDPVFVLARHERPAWRALLDAHGLAVLEAPDLARVAAAIFESGWFIGTDSGIGHLASACGIPTVTIADRPRNMNSWRPMWAPGAIVRPWWLPLRSLRRACWREATTVGKVLRTFQALRRRVERQAPAGVQAGHEAPPTPAVDKPA
ncbi:hypothetical protein CAL26_20165 [Bordetella genomosp. 9]|uniref:ADP-heptose--LPS heptosyltransferase n=1 Tax=Bordetella genomosp. 9 TaxID=1416803 RepID=A0A261R4C5_9BORD|nr:glycosyltransferase family 9 protein [Bordetella genomosp. 9]OZI19879.1 hypothetical protein CAL26_20165 [Bordetella genomosp. 9]